ncbi:MAG: class I SAM-dependent methyltransferase [Syntrophobacteraceae bacterium]
MVHKKDFPMEGMVARWYAATTRKDLKEFHDLALRLDERIKSGEKVLEVAPGPGYLSIELARRGKAIAGLDLSHTLVKIATENANKAGVKVDFHQGNVASMPFSREAFNLVVCRAAFKNFAEPIVALDEIYRVLKAGGCALIIDLKRDASVEAIDQFIDASGRGWFDSLLTKMIFRYLLIPRSFMKADFEAVAAGSRFGGCKIDETLIGYEVWLQK